MMYSLKKNLNVGHLRYVLSKLHYSSNHALKSKQERNESVVIHTDTQYEWSKHAMYDETALFNELE